ncbi:heavy-metal-associated domain-containing protein [Clostridium paraputrificum]|uniref:heavy-metal-associated domain-containing protein n=1 Tax=Clostridium TaxID=1485 RepID=UPI003D343088
MNRVHYTVNGLVNTTSKTQVKNALDKIEGVQDVCVDIGRGTVEVMFSEASNEEAIRSCIENTGHKIE